jgi:N-acetylneuraminic acid mutarotase
VLATLILVSALGSAGAPAGHTDYNEWLELAPLPTPRGQHMTAFVETDSGPRLYVIGGQRSVSDPMEKTCLEYSPRTNSWRARAKMRDARGLGQAFAVGGKVYVLGGCATIGTPLAEVEVFDPETNNWSLRGDMPESLYDFSVAVWRDSLVYVIGGGSWFSGLPPKNRVWLFDPAGRMWRPASGLPLPLGASCAGAIGDTIVVATGWTESGPTNRAWAGYVDTLDPTTISWHEIETLPGARRCRAAGAVLDNDLYVVGGLTLDSAPADNHQPESFRVLGDAWCYSLATTAWSGRAAKPSPTANAPAAAGPGLHKVCIAGGYPGVLPYLRTTEALNLGPHLHDCAVTAIRSPAGRMTPEDTVPVVVTFRNFGALTESAPCRVSLYDSTVGSVALSVDTTVELAIGASLDVEFGLFVPEPGRVFGMTAAVGLTEDEDRTNDTLFARTRTTPGSDPDGFGYVYESTQEPDFVTFAWFDTAGSTHLGNWNPNPDEGTSQRRLPFDFRFYGDSANYIWVCTNGFIGYSDFVLGQNRPLPFEGISGLVAPFWDDLDLTDTGAVYEKLSADTALYTWLDVPRYQTGSRTRLDSGLLSFQVAFIYPGTIRFNYLRMAAACSSATIGIQGGDGAYGWYSEYVYNGEPARHIPVDSTSVVFREPGSGVSESPGSAARPRFAIRPNPVGRVLSIALPPRARRLKIVDITGRTVECFPTDQGQGPVEIDLESRGIAPGVYVAVVETPGGMVAARFVVTGPLP